MFRYTEAHSYGEPMIAKVTVTDVESALRGVVDPELAQHLRRRHVLEVAPCRTVHLLFLELGSLIGPLG